jgi:hypothetical protein
MERMLTVAQAADRVWRRPETIRRRIRAGRLCARLVGCGYMIADNDLLDAAGDYSTIGLLPEWERSESGEPQPDWVRLIRISREERAAHLREVLRTQQQCPTPQPGVSD